MRYRFQHRNQLYDVTLERRGSTYTILMNGRKVDFDLVDSMPGKINLEIDGRRSTVYIASDDRGTWVSLDGCAYHLEKPITKRSQHGHETGSGESIRAPMPAQVTAIKVEAGEKVEKGQLLMLLEAMKMEIRIKAPANGILTRLFVKAGQTVERDQMLVEMG